MSSFDWVVCPLCRGRLQESDTHLMCGACDQTFPIHLGIPDFRSVAAYRGSWEEEAELMPRLIERFSSADVHDLLEEMLAGLSRADERGQRQLRDYFVDGLAVRAAHRAAVIDALSGRYGGRVDFSSGLEIGCGAGATLFELSRRGSAIGIDPNLLHLVIAKKHAEMLNLSVRFVCGFAEYLPFPDAAFSFVHFMHTLEHFTDQSKGLAEVNRLLAPGGMTCFDIPNRYSLWREPHTNIWGIGFLPRRWTALKTIKNQSLWRLQELVREGFGEAFQIHTIFVRFQVPGYNRGRVFWGVAQVLRLAESVPILRGIVRFFQPGFEVVAQKT